MECLSKVNKSLISSACCGYHFFLDEVSQTAKRLIQEIFRPPEMRIAMTRAAGAVLLVCLGIWEITAVKTSPEASTSSSSGNAKGAASPDDQLAKLPLACDVDTIKKDFIDVLQGSLGFPGAVQKLTYNNQNLAEKIIVTCKEEKLVSAEIKPQPAIVTISGTYSGACSVKMDGKKEMPESRKYATDVSYSLEFSLRLQVTATDDVAKATGSLLLTDEGKSAAKKLKCAHVKNNQRKALMIEQIQADLMFVFQQSMLDALGEKWVSACPSDLDRQQIFEQYARGVLKVDDQFQFAERKGQLLFADEAEKDEPLYTNEFTTKPTIKDMVLRCSNGKLDHVGFRNLVLWTRGALKTSTMKQLRKSPKFFDLELTLNIDFDPVKGVLTPVDSVLAYRLKNPLQGCTPKCFVEDIYTLSRQGLRKRMELRATDEH